MEKAKEPSEAAADCLIGIRESLGRIDQLILGLLWQLRRNALDQDELYKIQVLGEQLSALAEELRAPQIRPEVKEAA